MEVVLEYQEFELLFGGPRANGLSRILQIVVNSLLLVPWPPRNLTASMALYNA